MPPPGLDKLKHLVVLMMENRSFDHMLGGLKATRPAHRRSYRRPSPTPTRTASPGAGPRRRRSTRASSIPTPITTSRPSTSRSSTAACRRADDGGLRQELLRPAPRREALEEDHVPLRAREAAGADRRSRASSRSSTAGSPRFPGRRSATARSRTTARRSATSA